MDSIWVEVFLIGVSILANAFFAGSEIALISARPSRLSQLRAHGVPGADVAETLKKDPDAFLATIQMAITLVGTLASAVGGAAAAEALTPRLQALGLARGWGPSIAPATLVLAIAVLSLLIRELTPTAPRLRQP